MSAGLTAQQLRNHMNLSRRTMQYDVAKIKQLFGGSFNKRRVHVIPIHILEKHYGFDRQDILEIMEAIRQERLDEMQQGLTTAEVALIMQQPYRNVLTIMGRLKMEHRCSESTFKVPTKILRVNICSNILELADNAISRANTTEGLKDVMYCSTCIKSERYCNKHAPYQYFLTPANNIRVHESWNRANKAVTNQLSIV